MDTCPDSPKQWEKERLTWGLRKGVYLQSILFWGWDLDHQSYSREGSGFLRNINYTGVH